MKALKDFVVDTYDAGTWRQLLEDSGVGYKIYVPVTEYDDGEAMAIVGAAVETTDLSQEELLVAFGEYLVDPLVSTYGVHVDGEWTALELLANVETYIHEALRAKNVSEFTPPDVSAERVDESTVRMVYRSDRGLCQLIPGLLDGIAGHYGTELATTERRCMHEGADHCEFVIREVGAERSEAEPEP